MNFFYVNILFLFISIFSYSYFRIGISSYYSVLKTSKTFIRKHSKGKANYWLYKQLHQKKSLGILYRLNMLFLFGLLSFLAAMLFSLISWMQTPIMLLGFALGLIEIPALFMALRYINQDETGKSFVLFAVIKDPVLNGKRRFHTVFDWLFCILPFGLYLFLIVKMFG